MIFKRISRADPERVFIVVKNGYAAATLTNGQPVQWDMTAADGVTVDISGAAFKRMAAFAGIIAESIAYGSYGLMQVYGYHGDVPVDCSTTGKNIHTGAPLFFSVNAFNLEGPYLSSGVGIEELYVEHRVAACALEAHTKVGTTARIAVMIYAM